MSDKLQRIYQKLDIKTVKDHVMIYGDLSGSCSKCQAIDLKMDVTVCPKCETEFKYVSFRNVKVHLPKMFKLMEERPHLGIIDYDDYKRNVGALKAEEFLK